MVEDDETSPSRNPRPETRDPKPEARGYYVYAIMEREALLPASLLGIHQTPLVAVHWRALTAVASPVDPVEVRPLPEHLLRHEAVVEALCQAGRALPVRFGTVLAGVDAVRQALAARYAVLAADLARLGGRVEFGLSVLWEPERLEVEPDAVLPEGSAPPPSPRSWGEEPGAQASSLPGSPPRQRGDEPGAQASSLPGSPPRQRGDEAAAPSPLTGRAEERAPGPSRAGGEAMGPGARYLRARLVEHRRQEQLQARARLLALTLDEALCHHALASRSTVLPTHRLVLSVAYLLEPGRVGAFQAVFEEVRRAQPGLRFLLTGPWPPYSFVTPPKEERA